MNYNIIGSSSKGNCLIIDNKIMIDCGVSFAKVKPYLKDVKVICLTHSHKDHFMQSTIRMIHKAKPNIVFICKDYLVSDLLECGVSKRKIFRLQGNLWYNIGLCQIKTDKLIHDVPNVAYHIRYNGKTIFYATDTGTINHIEALKYDYYFIEANYESDEELDKRIKEAEERDEYTHLKRVKHTHLSQVQCMDWLYKNLGSNSQYIWMHQHEEKEVNEE